MRDLLRDERQKEILNFCELKITNQIHNRAVKVRASVGRLISYNSTVSNYKRRKNE